MLSEEEANYHPLTRSACRHSLVKIPNFACVIDNSSARPPAAHGAHLGDVGRVGVEAALEVVGGRRVRARHPRPGDARRLAPALQVAQVRRPHAVHRRDHAAAVRLVHVVATCGTDGILCKLSQPEGRSSVVGLRARFQFGAHVLFWRFPGAKKRLAHLVLHFLGGNRT